MFIVIIVMAILVIAYFYAFHYFLNFALKRPPERNRMSAIGMGTEYEPEVIENMNWLHEHDNDQVYITSFDGLRLKGHYYENPNAKRTILFFHGWHGAWDRDFAHFASYFAKECNFLLIEERAQGASEGEYLTMGAFEQRDALAWIDFYLKEKKPADCDLPVYIMGVSMGCATVLLTAGNPLPDEIKGVIADCGYSSAYDTFKYVGKHDYHMPEKPLLPHLNYYTKKKLGFALDIDVTDAMKKCQIPVFFVHGKGDTFVLPYHSQVNYDACASRKTLLYIEKADHCLSYLYNKELYTKTLEEFFGW